MTRDYKAPHPSVFVISFALIFAQLQILIVEGHFRSHYRGETTSHRFAKFPTLIS